LSTYLNGFFILKKAQNIQKYFQKHKNTFKNRKIPSKTRKYFQKHKSTFKNRNGLPFLKNGLPHIPKVPPSKQKYFCILKKYLENAQMDYCFLQKYFHLKKKILAVLKSTFMIYLKNEKLS